MRLLFRIPPVACERQPAVTRRASSLAISFCRNCGQSLAAGDAFCPKCGTLRGIAAATPNAAAAQPAKAQKKKTLAIIVAILALVAIVVGAVAVNAKPKGPDFQALHDEYCSSPWAQVGDDGSYLAIDTNPYNTENGDYPDALQAFLPLRISTRLLALTSRFTREWVEPTLWRACRARLATA